MGARTKEGKGRNKRHGRRVNVSRSERERTQGSGRRKYTPYTKRAVVASRDSTSTLPQEQLVSEVETVPELRGAVKMFLPDKRYGFIEPGGGGPNVFFHHSHVVNGAVLAKGQPVAYHLVFGPRGFRAEDVRAVQQ